MLKPTLSLLAGVLMVFSVTLRAEVELRADHPDTYVVQRGDTLWDISAKFLKSPWLWPEIWHANPQVANPHEIYPGDVLSLVYIDGKAQIVKLEPRVRVEPLPDSIGAIELSRVEHFLRKMRILEEDAFKKLPYVVATEEHQPLATPGENIYVRGLDQLPTSATSGTVYAIVRPTLYYREVPPFFRWDEKTPKEPEVGSWDARRGFTGPEFVARYWRNYAYWKDVETLGFEVVEIGQAKLIRDGDPATLLLTASDMEVKAGDMVLPVIADPFDLKFYPRAPKAVPENTRIISVNAGVRNVGPNSVVAINRGARDGIENGQVFAVYHPGKVIQDEVKYPKERTTSWFRRDKTKQVTLPEEFAGQVMIFKTFDKVSYALAMDMVEPAQVGDFLRAP
jgi:hypothetical protein